MISMGPLGDAGVRIRDAMSAHLASSSASLGRGGRRYVTVADTLI